METLRRKVDTKTTKHEFHTTPAVFVLMLSGNLEMRDKGKVCLKVVTQNLDTLFTNERVKVRDKR